MVMPAQEAQQSGTKQAVRLLKDLMDMSQFMLRLPQVGEMASSQKRSKCLKDFAAHSYIHTHSQTHAHTLTHTHTKMHTQTNTHSHLQEFICAAAVQRG
jgi:hypothetical protein